MSESAFTGLDAHDIAGTGVDVVDLSRFRGVLERTPRIVGRLFTPDERRYAETGRGSVERFAVRFAAKEAVLKAMGVGLFSFPLTQIEIVRDRDSGAPFVRLHGRALEFAEARHISAWHLTMTHTREVAEAVVVAVADSGRPTLRMELFPDDLDRTVSFYESVLGFVVERREEHYAHLRLGRIELGFVPAAALPDDNPPKPRPGDAHGRGVEVVVEVPDLDATRSRVMGAGVPVDDPVEQPWGLRDFRLTDPDGIYLRITSR